jgi:chromosome segregation ATPase
LKTLAANEAAWERSEKEGKALSEAQWRILQENTSQIAGLLDSLDILRQDVAMLKYAHEETLPGSFADVHSRLDTVVTQDYHVTLQQRVSSLEEAHTGHHASALERLDYLEKLIGDNADKHEQAVAKAHEKLDAHQQDIAEAHGKLMEAHTGHHASTLERLDYLEQLIGDNADKHEQAVAKAHEKLDAHQQDIAEAHGKLTEAHTGHHASALERLDYLEQLIGDNADKHVQEVAKALEKLHEHHQDLAKAHEKLDERERHSGMLEQTLQDLGQQLGDTKSLDLKALHSRIDELHLSHRQTAELHAELEERVHGKQDAEAMHEHHATLTERMDYLESLIGDNADKHFEELEARHAKVFEKLDAHNGIHGDLHSKVEYLEKLISDASTTHGDKHAEAMRQIQEVEASLSGHREVHGEHSATIQERIEYIEKIIGESADTHNQHKEHIEEKLGERERHIITLEDRLQYLEQQVGSSAMSLSDSHELLKNITQELDEHKKNSRKEADERNDNHVTLEQRVEFLESKVCDATGKYAKEMDFLAEVQEIQKRNRTKIEETAREMHGSIGLDGSNYGSSPADFRHLQSLRTERVDRVSSTTVTQRTPLTAENKLKTQSLIGQAPPLTPPKSNNLTGGSLLGVTRPTGASNSSSTVGASPKPGSGAASPIKPGGIGSTSVQGGGLTSSTNGPSSVATKETRFSSPISSATDNKLTRPTIRPGQ